MKKENAEKIMHTLIDMMEGTAFAQGVDVALDALLECDDNEINLMSRYDLINWLKPIIARHIDVGEDCADLDVVSETGEEEGWIKTDEFQRLKYLGNHCYQIIGASYNCIEAGYVLSEDMVVDMTPGGFWIDGVGVMTPRMESIFECYHKNIEDFAYQDPHDREQILAEMVYEQTSVPYIKEGYGVLNEEMMELVLDHFIRYDEYLDLSEEPENITATYIGASLEQYREDLKFWSNASGELHHHGEYDITENQLPDELKTVYQGYWEECPNGLFCYLAEYAGIYGLALIAEYHEKTPEGKDGEINNKKQAYRVRNLLAKLPYIKGALIIAEECGFPGYGSDDNATELVVFIPAEKLEKKVLERIEYAFGKYAYL